MLSFISGNYTDLYQLTMGEVFFLQGKSRQQVCYDYFFRKNPFEGGYVLFAGLQDLLNLLEGLHFTEEDIRFLEQLKFKSSYLEFLRSFRFNGAVYSVREGEVIFGNEPVLRVEGNQFEAQLVETVLLNILNFQSLIATKASRIRYVAGNAELSDFGMRRAQGPAAVLATRAAIIGGFNSTSNVYAAGLYGLRTAGTMAHAFIQGYDSELDAFRAYARSRPDNAVFLVDTYDTLKSGIPSAIQIAKEMEREGLKATGIRLDSGDLAWLSVAAREMLDEAGLSYMKIVVSNQLDEYVIRSLVEQRAPIDVYGVGTKLVTGQPDAALDGVYKLSFADGRARLKLSESVKKTTLPGIKKIIRTIDGNGMFNGADAVALVEESSPDMMYHPFETGVSLQIGKLKQENLLEKVMEAGKPLRPALSLQEIAAYGAKRLSMLPHEYRRFENPHHYKIGLTEKLLNLRNTIRNRYKI